MPHDTDRRAHVLVVDDERDVAETQALRIGTTYETSVAYSGEAALEQAGPGVDAILLDRRMPDCHGDEVLARLRDRGYEGVVIMLTAVDPDLNIIEMDFDDYLQKPVDGELLLSTLEQHLDGGDDRLNEFLRVTSKLQVLEAQRSTEGLADSSEYAALKARAEELEATLRDEMDEFDTIVETYRSIERSGE
ncbi:response regulator [Haloarcula sediminis]|uniref:response regulator n=1 Tax=Haloarcula sediminis TaxID=3111777 RepID=UPI002D786028|nr:response regulator [Haloarcula sp. CK38]